MVQNDTSLSVTIPRKTGYGVGGVIMPQNKIDLTNYTKLTATISNYTYAKRYRVFITVFESNDDMFGDEACALYQFPDSGTYSLDISNLSGEYYVAIGLYNADWSTIQTIYIHSFYLGN